MTRVAWALAACLLLAGCDSSVHVDRPPTARSTAPSPSPASPQMSESAGSPSSLSASPSPSDEPDPRWQFWSHDTHWYSSPWFAGEHRVMIGYGCTADPYYDPDPRCPRHEGFHHGIDVAMPCGTPLYAARPGVVVDPRIAGALGPAYGPFAFRIRTLGPDPVDIVIGHVLKVYVDPGQAVRRGQLIARANDQGAPDGCHLHFEVRPAGAEYTRAVDPSPYLRLRQG